MDDLIWEERAGGILYSGDFPVDMGPAETGDEVRLQANEYEFDVIVDSEDEEQVYYGTVVRIGPVPCLEAEGVARGDTVSFSEEHIFQIKRS